MGETDANAIAEQVRELFEAGSADDADELLKTNAAEVSRSPELLLLRGELSAAQGQWRDAADAFAQARRLDATSRAAIVGLANALTGLGKARRGRWVLYRAVKAYPDDASLWLTRGTLDHAAGRNRRAARRLARALALSADDRDTLYALTHTLIALDRHNEARMALEDTGCRVQGSAWPLWLLGFVEYTEQHLEAAEAAFARARTKQDSDDSVIQWSSLALRQLGRTREASALLEARLDGDDNPPAELLVALAAVEFAAGRVAEATATCQRALELHPGDPDAAIGVATLLTEDGRPAKALDVLLGALQHAPDDRQLLLATARNAAAQQQYGIAVLNFERALAAAKSEDDQAVRKELRRARLLSGIGLWWPLGSICRSLDRDTRRLFDEARPAVAVLDDIFEPDDPHRERLRARALALSWRRARARAVLNLATRPAILLWTIASFAILFLLPLGMPESLRPTGDQYAVHLMIAGGLYTLSVSLLARRAQLLAVVASALAVAVAATLLIFRKGLPDFALPVVSALAALSACLILLFVVISVIGRAEVLAMRRVRTRDPYASSVTSLLVVLYLLRRGLNAIDRDPNRFAVATLEDAAAGLRDHLKQFNPIGDIRTTAWLAERAEGTAAAMRELKTWLLSPGAETPATLSDRLKADLHSIADGRFRDLPWTDPAVAAAGTRRLRAISFARNLVVAALPLAIVLGVRAAGVVDEAVADQGLFFAIIWAMGSLLITLDPQVSQKLAFLKDSAGVLSKSKASTG